MALYRNNKHIPKKSIRVLSLIKIAIFNLSTTSNHPCDELTEVYCYYYFSVFAKTSAFSINYHTSCIDVNCIL